MVTKRTPGTKLLSVVVSDALHDELKAYCEQEETSMSRAVRLLVKKHLASQVSH